MLGLKLNHVGKRGPLWCYTDHGPCWLKDDIKSLSELMMIYWWLRNTFQSNFTQMNNKSLNKMHANVPSSLVSHFVHVLFWCSSRVLTYRKCKWFDTFFQYYIKFSFIWHWNVSFKLQLHGDIRIPHGNKVNTMPPYVLVPFVTKSSADMILTVHTPYRNQGHHWFR